MPKPKTKSAHCFVNVRFTSAEAARFDRAVARSNYSDGEPVNRSVIIRELVRRYCDSIKVK